MDGRDGRPGRCIATRWAELSAQSANRWRSRIPFICAMVAPSAHWICGRSHPPSGAGSNDMMKREIFEIAKIYVPVRRRSTLKPELVREIAESMLAIGQQTPILVRRDGARFVLVEGLHRLE